MPTNPDPNEGGSRLDVAAEARRLTEQVKSIQAIGQEFAALVDRLRTLIAFDHPDLTQLDDELDTLYRGQL